jgi:prepilin-type N-terminal cleavage/methylation domain-containing protein
MRYRPKGFTLVEMLVVVTIIVVLAAMLIPSLEQAVAQAQRAVCAAKLSQIGAGLMEYAQVHSGSMPPIRYRGGGGGRVTDFGEKRWYAGNFPNPLGSLKPWFGSTVTFSCPLATIPEEFINPSAPPPDELAPGVPDPTSNPPPPGPIDPTANSDTSYKANGVTFRLKYNQLPSAADAIYFQEFAYRSRVMWYRPYAPGDKLDGPFRNWHYAPEGVGQLYGYIHDRGGNLLFADRHVEYRKGADLRARHFGLTGNGQSSADDTQDAPSNNSWTYLPAY